MRVTHVGADAQERLGGSHACIIGVGALGCVSSDLLARAGVGTITVIDRDLVERSNLHRQPLFTESDADAKRPKALAARDRLLAGNSEIAVHAHIADFGPGNAHELINHTGTTPDVLIDGTDNFSTRYLINDCSVKLGIPYIYGGAISTSGAAAVFTPGVGPCLRCLHPDLPQPGTQPTCQTAGVLAPVSSIIGSYQAAEALKVLMGQDDRVMKSMLSFDLWEGQRTRLDLTDAKDPLCPCCGLGRFDFLDAREHVPEPICGRQAVQIHSGSKSMLDLVALGASLNESGDFEVHDYMIRGRIEHSGEQIELTCFADGRAIIDGTDDPVLARAVYARYIGN